MTTLSCCSASTCCLLPTSKNLRPICVSFERACARLKRLLRMSSFCLEASVVAMGSRLTVVTLSSKVSTAWTGLELPLAETTCVPNTCTSTSSGRSESRAAPRSLLSLAGSSATVAPPT